MHISSIGVFANPQNEGAVEAVATVYAEARKREMDCYIDPSLKSISTFKNMDTSTGRHIDLMVALGGDGTILRAADIASEKDIPILGINFGRIGFLSEISLEGFCKAMDDIQADRFWKDSCMMLSCSVNGGEPKDCLNEAILYRKYFSGVITISITINGIDAGTMSGDGLIISTPTGSTGYSISAGGPIISSGMDVCIITPICPHTLGFRPIIAPSDAVICLSSRQEGFLALDGISTERIQPGDVIEIRRSGHEADFIRFSERNIYALIQSKLSL